jgi:hypothetical protein
MYHLLVEPFTYPVSRREVDTQLFKQHGRIKTQGPLLAEDLALLSLSLTKETPAPPATSEQLVIRDATPTIANGRSIFGWSIRAKTAEELNQAKATKLSDLANIRWVAEESGTTLGDDTFATDRTTQAKITAAYTKVMGDPEYAIANWKFSAGVFAVLDSQMIISAAYAVEHHVQSCFSNEALLSENVLAAVNFAALEAVDLTVGWP